MINAVFSSPVADQGLHPAENFRALSLSLLDWPGSVDLLLFFFILILMIGSLFTFHYGVYFYVGKFLAVVSVGWGESRVTSFSRSV